MTSAERRAANTAMESAFHSASKTRVNALMAWSERGGDYIELAERLNSAAAQAVCVLRTHSASKDARERADSASKDARERADVGGDPDRGPTERDPCRA